MKQILTLILLTALLGCATQSQKDAAASEEYVQRLERSARELPEMQPYTPFPTIGNTLSNATVIPEQEIILSLTNAPVFVGGGGAFALLQLTPEQMAILTNRLSEKIVHLPVLFFAPKR